MTEVEAGWFVISLLVAIILPLPHMIFAQVTLHTGLGHGRLSHTWWTGIAFGPLGPLVVRLLPPDDPDWLRDELEAAFSGGQQTGMRFFNGMFVTMIAPGCAYYLLVYFLLSGGLPFIWWAVPLVMLLALLAGWLVLRGNYPLPVNFPAPVVLEPGGAGRPPVVVFDHRVLQVSLRSKLLHVTGFLCVLFGVFDLLYALICFTADGTYDFTPHRPWVIVILVLLVVGAVASFRGSKRALRRLDDPECVAGLAVCYFCGRQVLPGQPWALRYRTLQARHADCPDIAPDDGEEVPPWLLEDLGRRQFEDANEPGRACRVCGQYIDPEYDLRRTCPECGRMYHRACYGPARECTYCANREEVPLVAESISRRSERHTRVLRDRYERTGVGAGDGADEFWFQAVCRSCLGFMKKDEGQARCGRCRRLFHTACMAGDGLCRYCAEGRGVPPVVEGWCRGLETGSITDLPPVCPECGAGTGIPNPGVCPHCGMALDYPGLGLAGPGYLAGYPGPDWDEEDWDDDEDWDESWPDTAKQHGWVESPNWCCACFPAPILFFACLMTFNKYLPDPWSDILIELGIIVLVLALVVGGVMWVVNRVRARLWPMPEPSPLKSVLTVVRTVLYWLAGVAVTVGFPLLGSDAAPVPGMTLVVFAGITLAVAILVSLFCLFIR